ncbi:MAG TPA: uroporphyrinogen decarboxylase family protein [bacterium]|nr:uroporphyrinogen decarboxylase family protein [bacterium]HPP29833.1 uroporphyrinogen decarboxylase family protein [bacterium]
MNFENVDHPPIEPHLIIWEDTLKRWHKEGYPEGADIFEYFGLEGLKFVYAGPDTGPYPHFEEKILSETESEVIKIDRYGRKIKDFKYSTTMPEWLEFPIKNKDDLERVIKERFDLSLLNERWPVDFSENIEKWKNEERDYVLFLDGGCYYGILRNLAGVEYASYLFYDAPDLVDELFERVNIICIEGIKKVLSEVKVEYLGFGEDIAYKTSTLVSPSMFKNFLFPRYKKVCEMASKYGVDITLYDSDGNLNPFMELYFESGIDGFIPCEVAADMDPVDLRRRYGKKIKMMGGLDKRKFTKGKEEIKEEVYKKIPVIEEGGYIPGIDHSVSSDISFENFSYYIKVLKEIYGMK